MKKYLLIAILILWAVLVSLPTWAACPAGGICYISPTGDDGAAGTAAAPWATIGKAVATYGTGETIHIADGDYLTTDGANGATYMTLNKPVIITVDSALGVKITATGNYVFYINATSTGTFTFPALVLDNNNAGWMGIGVQNTAFSPTINVVGTKFLNPSLRAITLSEDNPTALNITGAIMEANALSAAGGILQATALASGNITINGFTFTITSAAGAGGFEGIKLASSTGIGSAVSVAGVSGTFTGNGTGTINPGFISINNIPAADISTFNLTGTNVGTSQGIQIIKGAGGSAGATIHNGTLNLTIGTGYAILSDANNTYVYDNILTNGNANQAATPHGIAFTGSTGSKAYRNIVSGSCPAYYGEKTDATTIFSYNLGHHNYGNYVYYAKGATGTKFINNTNVSITGYNATCMAEQTYTTDSTHSTGVIFTNNICYNSSTNPVFLITDANQTGTFTTNQYYASEALIATSWQYGGNSYNTFAGWDDVETTAKWGNPLFTSASDFTLLSTSPAINAGVFVSGIHNAAGVTDLAGKSLHGPGIDIGAYGTAYPGTKYDFKE